jgi:leucyl-tRNA synthetase
MIYSRFWHKFHYDMGEVNTEEPYAKRTAQGLILGPDGEKMSKSRGNVIDPNEVVDQYGADVLRTYILFMGDYGAAAPWSESSIKGCKRFLDRVMDLVDMAKENGVTAALETKTHKLIKKVTSDIDDMKFNTAIASMMAYLNDVYEVGTVTKDELGILVRILCPFAPHICEEIWSLLGNDGLCSTAKWPEYDEAKTVDNTVEVAVQINGKVRGRVMLPVNCPKEEAIEEAKKAIAHYQDSDTELYQAIYDSIVCETITLRYLMLDLYFNTFSTAELAAFKAEFKEDTNRLDFNMISEQASMDGFVN